MDCLNLSHITSLTNSYTTQGLTYSNNATYVDGGYVQIGNLVVVNIRLSMSSSTAAQTAIIKGLPHINATTNIASVTNNMNSNIYIASYPSYSYVENATQLSSGTLLCSCVYMAD